MSESVVRQMWYIRDVVFVKNTNQATWNISEKILIQTHKDWFNHYVLNVQDKWKKRKDIKKLKQKNQSQTLNRKNCLIEKSSRKKNQNQTTRLNQKSTKSLISYDWNKNEHTRNNRQIWIIQKEMIETKRTRYVRLAWTSRCDWRQSDWNQIKISWRQTCIRPWLLIASDWVERQERRRLKKDFHRHNSKSFLRQWVLWTWTCIDYSKSNVWESDEQSKQRCWIHQCDKIINEEGLYNLIKTKWQKQKTK